MNIQKNVAKVFKDIGFTINIEINHNFEGFLDITFNLNNGIYRPDKTLNNLLSYIIKSSYHPPQTISHLPKIINELLSQKFLQ